MPLVSTCSHTLACNMNEPLRCVQRETQAELFLSERCFDKGPRFSLWRNKCFLFYILGNVDVLHIIKPQKAGMLLVLDLLTPPCSSLSSAGRWQAVPVISGMSFTSPGEDFVLLLHGGAKSHVGRPGFITARCATSFAGFSCLKPRLISLPQ